jgi:hypothetical protein
MKVRRIHFALMFACTGYLCAPIAAAQDPRHQWDPRPPRDSTTQAGVLPQDPTSPDKYPNVWSLDILLSNDGFGLGTIYRRTFTPDLSWFVAFSIAESKDEREVEYYDPYYGTPISPGKLNRFLVLPLSFGIQYRLFREDIVDTFRPFLNAGAGPAMIYMCPYMQLTQQPDGSITADQIDFFKSLGKGQPHYTVGGFVGFGANFGTDRSSIFGVNFRYYFTYLLSGALPSLYDERTGAVAATKNDFGGFVISLNVGTAF